MLRPRTNQVVSIIDELLQQSNRDQGFTPRSPFPFPSTVPFDQGSTGSSMRTFNKAQDMFNVAGAPTPMMSRSLRSQQEPFRPPVNLGDTSAVAPGVPADVQVGQLNVPQVTGRQIGPEEYAANMPGVPGSNMDMRAAVQESEAKMRDLGSKATQAALLEAKNPDLKKDPTFQDRIQGFFGDRGNMLRLALAFNTMRLNPDQGLAAMLGNELKDLRTQNRSTNTAARLRQLGTPAAIRAAEYIESTGDTKGGLTMYNKAGSITQKTGAELGGEAAGYDPKKTYNVDTLTGKISGVGGGGVSVNVEGDKSKLFDVSYKYIADNRDAFVQEGIQAQNSLQAFGRMSRALDFTDTGKEEQNRQAIRTMLDGFGLSGLIDEDAYANAAAFNAAANALVAEELRANKGPQTDFDARFAQTYIPGLGNPKEANREILKYGRSTAQIKKLLGRLANRVSPTSDTVIQDMEEVNEYALTVPNVVIKTDGTVMHFYDFYSENKTVDPGTLFKAWMTFANNQREAGLQ